MKLNVDQQTASDLIPNGTIISQAQGGGSNVDPGSTIGVTVSTGPVPVAVPDVSGKSPADASAALQAAGFVRAHAIYRRCDERERQRFGARSARPAR